MKYLIGGVAALGYVSFCGYVFNHGNPWIGIGLGVVGACVAAYMVEKQIRKTTATTKE